MKILFIHQNFPGQFLHLAPALASRGHECLALTDAANQRATPIRTVRYRHDPPPADPVACRLGRTYTEMSDRGVTVARAAAALRDRHGFVPDLVVGHSGWGETLFLKQVWPSARLLIYAEFYYGAEGRDVGFDPEFPGRAGAFDQALITTARAAHLGASMLAADAALAPTRWQAGSFPPALRPMIRVIFDGIDTDAMRPDPAATFDLPDGRALRPGDEVLTFVNRNLEPYRGYHVFMRALPAIMAARPQAEVVIVGGDGTSYGPRPASGTSWRDRFLAEVTDGLDPTRLHFMGRVPYDRFRALMQVSRAHAYLTYPFVLSWSMLEAMAAGAHVVASRTAPVTEVIKDGVNGTLVDFFDTEGWSTALISALAEPDRFDARRSAARETIVSGGYDLRGHCLPQLIAYVEQTGQGADAG